MMRAPVCEDAGCVARVARAVPRIGSAYMTLHRIAPWAACLLLLGVGAVADADTLMDDFEDPEFTEALWDVKQGDWRSEDGWWHGFSPAIGQGAFALFSDIETHDGLRIQVTEQHIAGGWSNGYIIFAYVSETEVYYAGARIGRGNWTIEKSALAGGEQNFGEVGDARIAGGAPLPRYTVVIEQDDVVIYDDEDDEVNRHTFAAMPVGRIGLANENAETKYDDFAADGPAVAGLAVSPKDRLATTWAELKERR